MEPTLYLLACDTVERGGGVFRFRVTPAGLLEKIGCYPCDRPMYAVMEGGRLHILLRAPFAGSEESGYFSLSPDLISPTPLRPTGGKCACHLAVAGDDIYVTNYLSGNLVRLGGEVAAHTGHGVNPARQAMPHTHCAILSPDKKYVLCCDLGLDTLFCYDRALNPVCQCKVASGDGIRHAVFSQDGKYVYAVSEMVPALYVFSFDGGALTLLSRTPIPCETPHADGAAIRLADGDETLYVSCRVENALFVYSVNGTRLTLRQREDCGGDSPRDFLPFGGFLAVTNEKSDNVVVYARPTGKLGAPLSDTPLAHPLCCVLGEDA